jgi:hypothetical protein
MLDIEKKNSKEWLEFYIKLLDKGYYMNGDGKRIDLTEDDKLYIDDEIKKIGVTKNGL